MRKFKKLLMTLGIASTLAVGVGAAVATHSSDAIRADAASKSYPENAEVVELKSGKISAGDYTFSEKTGKYCNINGGFKEKTDVTITRQGAFPQDTIGGTVYFGMDAITNGTSDAVEFRFIDSNKKYVGELMHLSPDLPKTSSASSSQICDITTDYVAGATGFEAKIPGFNKAAIKTLGYLFTENKPSATRKATELKINNNNASVTVAEGYLNVAIENLLTAEVTYNEAPTTDNDVTWSIDETTSDVATIDAKTGAITFTKNGTAKVTATSNILNAEGKAIVKTIDVIASGLKELTVFTFDIKPSQFGHYSDNVANSNKYGLTLPLISTDIGNFNSDANMQFKKNTGELKSEAIKGKIITNVTVTYDKNNKNELNLFASSNNNTWTSIGKFTSSKTSIDLNAADGYTTFKIKNAGDALVHLTNISVTYELASPMAKLDKTTIETTVGAANQFVTATIANFKGAEFTHEWSVENTAVANIVSGQGTGKVEIEFLSEGQTTLTYLVTDDNDLAQATCTINVAPAPEPTITIPATLNGHIGDGNATITATLSNFTDTALEYLWSIDGTNVEIVGADNASSVEIKYLTEGTTTLNVTVSGANDIAEANCVITVLPERIAVSISEFKTTYSSGQTEFLTGVVADAKAVKDKEPTLFIADPDNGESIYISNYTNPSGLKFGDEIKFSAKKASGNEISSISNITLLNENVAINTKTVKAGLSKNSTMVDNWATTELLEYTTAPTDLGGSAFVNFVFKSTTNKEFNVFASNQVSGAAKQAFADKLELHKKYYITGLVGEHSGDLQMYLTDNIQIVSEDTLNVREFVKNFMHLDDYKTDMGWCKDSEHNYYKLAKAALIKLGASGIAEFQNNSEFSAAKARYEDWARANLDFENCYALVDGSNVTNFNSKYDTVIITIVSIAILATAAIVMFSIIQHKKLKNR